MIKGNLLTYTFIPKLISNVPSLITLQSIHRSISISFLFYIAWKIIKTVNTSVQNTSSWILTLLFDGIFCVVKVHKKFTPAGTVRFWPRVKSSSNDKEYMDESPLIVGRKVNQLTNQLIN